MTPYYQDELVTLYHGDALEILPALKIDLADATITDPPYAVRRDAQWDKFDGDLDLLGFTGRWMAAAADLTRVQVVFFSNRYLHVLRDAARYAGTPFRRSLIWRKPPGSQYAGAATDGFWHDFEMIEVFGKPEVASRVATRFGVIDQRTVVGQGHGCEKPLALVRLLVEAYSAPGGTVIEPFAGSGTVLRAAKDLGRKAIGIEMDEAHCESVALRLAQEVLDFGEAS